MYLSSILHQGLAKYCQKLIPIEWQDVSNSAVPTINSVHNGHDMWMIKSSIIWGFMTQDKLETERIFQKGYSSHETWRLNKNSSYHSQPRNNATLKIPLAPDFWFIVGPYLPSQRYIHDQ